MEGIKVTSHRGPSSRLDLYSHEITPAITVSGTSAYVTLVEKMETQIVWNYVGIVDPLIHEVVVTIGAVTGKRQGVETKPGRTTDQNFVFGASH